MPSDAALTSPYLTVAEAALYAKRHKNTIANALRDGELRGHQPKPLAKWSILRDDLEAWIRGESISTDDVA